MKNYLTECIGTFFLVLTIGLTVVSGSALAPVAIGSMLMVLVYMGGHVSGAHYNPAVSIALVLRGRMEVRDLLPYIVSQIAGATLAAMVVPMLLGDTLTVAPAESASSLGALLVEVLFTFLLALVVLNVATAKKTEGNSYYGLAIGFTVLAGAFAGGPISGGAFNPAVGLGPAIVNTLKGVGSLQHAWLYLVGPILGAVLATAVFKVQSPGDR